MSVAGWIAVIVIALLFYGLSQLGRKREISDEEFEREAKRGASLLGNGLQELQGFLEPGAKAAMEVLKGEKRKTDQHPSGGSKEAGKD